MTVNTNLAEDAALVAIVPIVALYAALKEKGILSMADIDEQLSLIELQAATLSTSSARKISEAAVVAKDLLHLVSLHTYIGPPEEALSKMAPRR